MLSLDDRQALVAEASRAPSAHNAQPARWRFEEPDRLVLLEALGSRLSVADPAGRDARMGLGAALEGMVLALSRRGLGITDLRRLERPGSRPPESATEVVATARIVTRQSRDSLAERVPERRTFRGRFNGAQAEVDGLKAFVAARPDLLLIHDRPHVDELARLHDRASARFFQRGGYARELCAWLRLSPDHPRWAMDGLNAESLALSGSEAWAARMIMRPTLLRALTSARLIRLVVSEAATTRSATGVLVLTAEAHDAFEAGRLLYRRWLELDQAGWSACPMSALVDDEGAARRVRGLGGLPAGAPLASVLRVGRVGEGAAQRSPRLPPEELLL
jgi:hypothetical protein